MAEIPPWMNISPLQAVPFYLQGYGQGAQVGEAQRRAEQVAYDQSLHEAAQQERNEILREAKQIQAQEFAQTLKLKQDTAQRAAAEAAIQLEGQQGLEKDLQSGLSFQEAFPKWAPKLLYKHPQSLTEVMRNLEPSKNILPQAATIGGVDVLYNPATGAFQRTKQTPTVPTSVTAVPIVDDQGNVLGYGRPGAGGTVIPMRTPQEKPALTEKQKLDLQKRKFDILKEQKELKAGSPEAVASTNLVNAIDAAVSPAPKSAGTKVRKKGSTKEFIYRGDPKDIPLDQYDIVQ